MNCIDQGQANSEKPGTSLSQVKGDEQRVLQPTPPPSRVNKHMLLDFSLKYLFAFKFAHFSFAADLCIKQSYAVEKLIL